MKIVLLLLLLSAAVHAASSSFESASVARIVGDSPAELKQALLQDQFNLQHSTYYTTDGPVLGCIGPNPRCATGNLLSKAFPNNNIFRYNTIIGNSWNWNTLKTDFNAWQQSELFALEAFGGIENGRAVIKTNDGSRLTPDDPQLKSAFASKKPLFISDSAYSGLYLPRSFSGENSFIGALGQDSLVVATNAVPNRDFVYAFLCSLVKINEVGRAYTNARNLYYWESQQPSGLTLMSYSFYGSPFARVSFPSQVSESDWKAICQQYANTSGFSYVAGETVDENSIGKMRSKIFFDSNQTFSQEIQLNFTNYSIIQGENYSLLAVDGTALQQEYYELALPRKSIVSFFPLKSVIVNVRLVSLEEPVDLAVNLPSWNGTQFVSRVCLSNSTPAEIKFFDSFSQDRQAVVANIRPVAAVDCEGGIFRLYKKMTYKIEYYPNSPIIINSMDYANPVRPGAQVDLNVSLALIGEFQNSSVYRLGLKQGDAVVAEKLFSRNLTDSLQFNASSDEGETEYSLEFVENNETKTFSGFSLKTAFIDPRLIIPEVISGPSTQAILILNNLLDTQVGANVTYYLLKGMEIRQTGVLQLQLTPGGNIAQLALDNLSRNDIAYSLAVDLTYLGRTKSISHPVITDHAPLLQEIQEITVNETQNVSITPVASDLEGDGITYAIGAPVGSDGFWQTGFNDSGVYFTVITASDGLLQDSRVVKINVLNLNRPPTITGFCPASGAITLALGQNASFQINASDLDGETLFYSWFRNETAENGVNNTLILEGTEDKVGSNNLTAFASDGFDYASTSWNVLVLNQTCTNQFCLQLWSPLEGFITNGSSVRLEYSASSSGCNEVLFYVFGAPNGGQPRLLYNGTSIQFDWNAGEGTHDWFVIASNGQQNSTPSQTRRFIVDRTPPRALSQGVNTTAAYSAALFYANLSDAQTGLSGFIFTWDNGTGMMQNSSWVSLGGMQNAQASAVKILPAQNALVKWAFYFNDSAGNWNSTGLQQFAVTSGNNWNSSAFAYARKLNISNTAGFALTVNYTANVSLNTVLLVTAGKLKADCSDVGVWDSIAKKELDRAVENCNSTATNILFRLQRVLPKNGVTDSYRLEYGNNQTMTPQGNKQRVYWFYDDFDDNTLNASKWVCNAGLCVESGGVLTVGGGGSNNWISTREQYSIVEILPRAKTTMAIKTTERSSSTVGFVKYGVQDFEGWGYKAYCPPSGGYFYNLFYRFRCNAGVTAYDNTFRTFTVIQNATKRTLIDGFGRVSSVTSIDGRVPNLNIKIYDGDSGKTSVDNLTIMQYIYPEPAYTLESEQQR